MSTSGFIRSASPLGIAAGRSSKGENPSTDSAARMVRHTAFQGASTVEELIAMIPSDYRTLLQPFLLEVAGLASKRASAQNVHSKWLAHQTAGTLPSHLRARAPEVQVTKEFGGQQSATAQRSSLLELHDTYGKAALAKSLELKAADLAHLETLLTPEALYKRMEPIIEDRANAILKATKLPRFDRVMLDGKLDVQLVEWVPNKAAEALAREVLDDCVVYAFRVISIVEVREFSLINKANKKKAIARAADVEMADGTKPGPSIQSLIDKAVSKAVKSSSSTKKVSPYSRTRTSDAYTPPIGHYAGGEVEARTSEEAKGPRKRRIRRQKLGQTQRNDQGRGEGQGEEEGAVMKSRPFRYDIPSSFPDWLLTVPLHRAVNHIILNTPVNVILASQFKSNIHLSTGVSMPLELQNDLSVGLRYMFHSPRNTQLIKEAYRDFVRRVRWRIYFTLKGEESAYDPDYEVPDDEEKVEHASHIPQYIDIGLAKGRHFVNETIAKIPEEEVRHVFKTLMPNAKSIREFLVRNDYVVTPTDKNLGTAVSERTWLMQKCKSLLEDQSNYRLAHPLTINGICDSQCTKMEYLASYVEEYIPDGAQLAKFLRSKITKPGFQGKKDGVKHYVPTFYGIPKIHKEPVKVRPIIPCHSAIQNPAAKYISKKLKPLIEAAPTIIHGSKDLAQKLSRLSIDRRRQWYIVTGDVVAFYPNIPIDHCLSIVSLEYMGFYRGGLHIANTTSELREDEVFHRALLVANKDLVTQFDGEYYVQTRGLAMGVADSPDLANIYGMHFERTRNVLNHPSIPFYGRYIDDCLAIVYASSEEEAVHILEQTVQFDECVIEWSASNQWQPFLDMRLFRDGNNALQHMPYRKARNHMERIPYISHHPDDVKRGTYIGEMSRLATLSSEYTSYTDAIKGLASLYIARGYPSDTVYKWTRENIRSRWEKRLSDNRRADASEVLVLKSNFNTAWNYFSATQLGETVLGFWRAWIEKAERGELSFNAGFPSYTSDAEFFDYSLSGETCSQIVLNGRSILYPDIRKLGILNRRMIVSRKRTRNLFDLTSLWKKTVLNQLEIDASRLGNESNEDIELHRGSSDESSSENDQDTLFQVLGYRQLA